MSTAIKISGSHPRRKTHPEKMPSAVGALKVLRGAVQEVAPRLSARAHVHGLLSGLEAAIKEDGTPRVYGTPGWRDLLDRVLTLLRYADEGEILPGGELSAERVSRLIHAARDATVRIRAYMPAVYPDPVVGAEG